MTWGYKTFIMLNSHEHEISTANKKYNAFFLGGGGGLLNPNYNKKQQEETLYRESHYIEALWGMGKG